MKRDFESVEHVIIDEGSEDNTVPVIKSMNQNIIYAGFPIQKRDSLEQLIRASK